ncbi:hypothetical protein M5K25_000733 [Dendrobium thyrsiflorum]|uniref:Uncharacterized protein n=1 Tax=Dendrobium thyrsiflorum TaxID=117978 RepID=A0ABD0VUQ3_DENTH
MWKVETSRLIMCSVKVILINSLIIICSMKSLNCKESKIDAVHQASFSTYPIFMLPLLFLIFTVMQGLVLPLYSLFGYSSVATPVRLLCQSGIRA